MPTQVASLFGTISLQDNFTPGLNNALRTFDGFGSRLQNIGSGFNNLAGAMAPVSIALGAFGATGIHAASGFESALVEIQARASLTDMQLEAVRETALRLGQDTQFSALQASEAFLQLLTSGQSVDQAMQTIEAVMMGAAASGQQLGYVSDGVTDVLASFQLQAEQSTAVVDTLTAASASSSATFGDMIEAFRNVGGTAAQFGLSVEDTAAVLSVFAENGLKGAEAGTQLRSMLNNMNRDTAAVQGMWEQLGISMFDTMGNARPLVDVMSDLRNSMAGMTEQERIRTIQTLAGTYGQLGLTALTSGGSMEDMLESMQGQAGAADVAAARMDTFAGSLEFLRGSIETLQIEVLTPFMNRVLRPLLDTVGGVINRFTEWAKANPELADTIVAIGAGLVALTPILFGVGTAFNIVGSAIRSVTALLAFLMSPIGAAIALAGALVAAYITNFGGFKDFIDNEVRPRLLEFFNWLGGVWEQIRPALEAIYNWFVVEALPAIVTFVNETVIPAMQDLWNFLGDVWEIVGPALEAVWNWFTQEALPAIVEFVRETVIPAIGDLIDIIANIWNSVREGLKAFVQGVTRVFTWLTQNVIIPFWNAINAIRQALGGLAGPANAVAQGLAGNPLGALGALIASRDSGGRGAAGQPVMIGTGAQPELFVPDSAGSFYPNAGGITINNLMVGRSEDIPEIEDALLRVLRRISN